MNSAAATTPASSDTPAESIIAWPSKTVLVGFGLVVYAIALFLIWTTSSFEIFHEFHEYDSNHYSVVLAKDVVITLDPIEILPAFVLVLWASLSVANSYSSFLISIINFSILIFVMLALVLNQDRTTFWAAFTVMVLIGLQELYDHLRARTLLNGGAQLLLILLAWLTLLHTLANYLLQIPLDYFAIVISYVTNVRIVLVTLFVFVVLLASILTVFPKFSWRSKEYLSVRQRGQFLRAIFQPIVRVINTTTAFVVNAAIFFVQVFSESISFVRDVFLDWSLWKTILNVGFIALWSIGIPWIVVHVKPHIFSILRTPSILASVMTGFDHELALSNLYVGGAFVGAIICVLGLALSWLTRKPDVKSAVADRIAYSALIIYVCIWLATITYFYPVSLILGLHSNLLLPGIYTLLVFPLALIAAPLQNRAQTESDTFAHPVVEGEQG